MRRLISGGLVEPLPSPLGSAVILEGGFEILATGVDQEVTLIEQNLDLVKTVHDKMVGTPGQEPRSEHPLKLGIGCYANPCVGGRGGIDPDHVHAAPCTAAPHRAA